MRNNGRWTKYFAELLPQPNTVQTAAAIKLWLPPSASLIYPALASHLGDWDLAPAQMWSSTTDQSKCIHISSHALQRQSWHHSILGHNFIPSWYTEGAQSLTDTLADITKNGSGSNKLLCRKSCCFMDCKGIPWNNARGTSPSPHQSAAQYPAAHKWLSRPCSRQWRQSPAYGPQTLSPGQSRW